MSETIGQTIRRLRLEQHLTQDQLAKRIDVTYQAVSRWEKDVGLPDISNIVPLSEALHVSTDLLLGKLTEAEDHFSIVNLVLDKISAIQAFLSSGGDKAVITDYYEKNRTFNGLEEYLEAKINGTNTSL